MTPKKLLNDQAIIKLLSKLKEEKLVYPSALLDARKVWFLEQVVKIKTSKKERAESEDKESRSSEQNI